MTAPRSVLPLHRSTDDGSRRRTSREPVRRARCTRGAEAELVDRAKQGDVGAFEALVAHHQGAATRLAAVIAGSADADDIAQEAFVKAYRALHRFHDGAAFRPWLLKIVANEARNHRRASGRRVRLTLRTMSSAPPPSPEDAAVAADRRQALLAALDDLPERDRLVLSCRFLLGLSEVETAAALDCAPGTVKSRTSRALARLRIRLEPIQAFTDG